jgi:phage terminase large subunit GpA-like protein
MEIANLHPKGFLKKTNRYINQDISFLLSQNELMPTRQPEKLISKWINGRRIMPPGSPFEGIYDINKGPYVIELCDNMSPYSLVRHQAVKKGVQIFATTIAENVIAYYMGERPAKIMYMTATDQLIEKFSNTRLDPLIDSCDLRHLIFSQTENVKSRKSGDKSQYKEFIGGTLALVSAQSPSGQRSESIKILIRDEIDGAPRLLKTGEGTFLAVSEGRVQAFIENGGKIFDFSTPGLFGESLIDEQYNKGDKRKFFVDCPMCGKEQFLSLGTEKSNYGLKGDYKAGKLIQGYYLCYHCHDAIFESSKIKLLESGVWKPTVENPPDKYFRSYHLPSFYSPGLATFTYIQKKYDEAVELGDDGLRSFTNLYLGKSFQPSGESPKLDHVYELRSKYKSGEVPRGIMYLTTSGDVQQGKDIYKEHSNDEISKLAAKFKRKKEFKNLEGLPRIEIEVLGHGMDFRTASIVYKHFYGRVDNYTSGAWEKFKEWINETGMSFKNKKGFKFAPRVMFIDSGNQTDQVYNFCDPLAMTFAIKGARELKQDKLKLSTVDAANWNDWQHYKVSKSGAYTFITIRTNYYKGQIYRKLKNKMDPINGQPPNSHQTPADYPDSYFKGLTIEKQRKDGSFHNPANGRNEPLDLQVYNLAASDYFVEGKILADRELERKRNPHFSKDKIRELHTRAKIMERFKWQLEKAGWVE